MFFQMGVKVHNFSSEGRKVQTWAFHCPGCGYDHAFTVGEPSGERPRWTFNGDLEKPSFSPSLLCNRDYPESRCHSWVTDGQIKFFNDCFHDLKNQTVEIPEWSGW